MHDTTPQNNNFAVTYTYKFTNTCTSSKHLLFTIIYVLGKETLQSTSTMELTWAFENIGTTLLYMALELKTQTYTSEFQILCGFSLLRYVRLLS